MLCIHDLILTENDTTMATNINSSLRIHGIPAFQDNYIWAIDNGQYALVVDPGDAEPVINYLKQLHLNLSAILITHHHGDHTGGIDELTQHFAPTVYGPDKERIKGVNVSVNPQDSIHIPQLDLDFTILDFAGHTRGHIGYYTEGILFCGDTLFSAGCGRIFEGSAAELFSALNTIKQLPQDTQIYCAHEYTQNNLQFALEVEPNNSALQHYAEHVDELRFNKHSTIPTLLTQELLINPFLRTDQESLQQALQQRFSEIDTDPLALFTFLREWKNIYPSPPIRNK